MTLELFARPCLKSVFSFLVFPVFFVGCFKTESALKRFPIGIYGVNEPQYIQELYPHGFDSLHTYSSDPKILASLAKEARRYGMWMVVAPEEAQKKTVFETRNWPIDAWYLQDEPDVYKTPPAVLENVSKKTRQWDPKRLQTFVIGQGAPAEKYGHIADILMLDWYPVPHLPLDSVAEQVDLARKFMPKDKPLWMVLQAMDWRDFPQVDPKKPRIGRFPNHAEIRFMSYLAIAHGARGLFYFTFEKSGGLTLFDYPEQWQAVVRVVREIKALQPVLEKGKPIDLSFEFEEPGLEAKVWRYRGRDYVIVLNRKKDRDALFPKELLDFHWRPLFEVRRDPRDLLKKSGDSWYLPPYQVMVFESRLRWF